MNDVPTWVGPTVAISLVVIAASFLVMGGVALAIGLGLRKKTAQAKQQLASYSADVKGLIAKLKGEVEGFTEISADARAKLKGAIATVDTRLQDLDALVEVLQTEAEETALDAAALMRTVRNSGKMLSAARAAMRRRGGR